MLLNMEATNLGLNTQLAEKGISVQGQDCYALKTPVDQRGEQTINKDAKTTALFIFQYKLNLSYQLIIPRICSDL